MLLFIDFVITLALFFALSETGAGGWAYLIYPFAVFQYCYGYWQGLEKEWRNKDE